MLHRAAEAEHKRRARERLEFVDDTAQAAGLKLGQAYVDPKKPGGERKPDEPYYSLKPLQEYREQFEKIAFPQFHTLAARIARREAEEEAMYARLESAMGV